MSQLEWISDDDLDAAVRRFRQAASDAVNKAASRRQQNVVDPFLSLLFASTFEVTDRDEMLFIEDANAGFRGITNSLGNFHQDVLGAIDGWTNHDAGYDVENTSERIIAEVKNKHNTMNSTNRQAVIGELDTGVRQKGQGWTGYLVVIVPSRPRRYERRLNTQRPVFEVDGVSFYHKATGDPDALHDLFDVLCNQLTGSSDIQDYCRNIMNESLPPRQSATEMLQRPKRRSMS